MDPTRFDRLTRRAALVGGGALASAAALGFGSHARAQDATPVASPSVSPPAAPGSSDPEADFLFVQVAPSATWAAKSGEDGTFVLTLAGHDGQTVYFSDRPERLVGVGSTQNLIANLGFTPADPPNAAIVAGEEVLVVELLNPNYDATTGTLTYEAVPLAPENAAEGLAHLANQQTDADLPSDLGPASLFIDSPQEECGEYDDCYYYDGTNWQSAGPIPGGPYDSCWNYLDFTCSTCHGVNYGWVVDQCNANYPNTCAASKENSCADAGTCFLEPDWGQDC